MSNLQLFNGNCFDVLPNIPSSSVHLFLCDLPYGVLNKQNPNASWDKPLDLKSLWNKMKRIGDTVCDPTMGSGSCGEACQNTHSNFIGIEMDTSWYEYASNRLNYHTDVRLTTESDYGN